MTEETPIARVIRIYRYYNSIKKPKVVKSSKLDSITTSGIKINVGLSEPVTLVFPDNGRFCYFTLDGYANVWYTREGVGEQAVYTFNHIELNIPITVGGDNIQNVDGDNIGRLTASLNDTGERRRSAAPLKKTAITNLSLANNKFSASSATPESVLAKLRKNNYYYDPGAKKLYVVSKTGIVYERTVRGPSESLGVLRQLQLVRSATASSSSGTSGTVGATHHTTSQPRKKAPKKVKKAQAHAAATADATTYTSEQMALAAAADLSNKYGANIRIIGTAGRPNYKIEVNIGGRWLSDSASVRNYLETFQADTTEYENALLHVAVSTAGSGNLGPVLQRFIKVYGNDNGETAYNQTVSAMSAAAPNNIRVSNGVISVRVNGHWTNDVNKVMDELAKYAPRAGEAASKRQLQQQLASVTGGTADGVLQRYLKVYGSDNGQAAFYASVDALKRAHPNKIREHGTRGSSDYWIEVKMPNGNWVSRADKVTDVLADYTPRAGETRTKRELINALKNANGGLASDVQNRFNTVYGDRANGVLNGAIETARAAGLIREHNLGTSAYYIEVRGANGRWTDDINTVTNVLAQNAPDPSTVAASAPGETNTLLFGMPAAPATPSQDNSGGAGADVMPAAVTAANNLIHGDQNNSGSLSAFEKRVFDRVDRNHDGTISRGEAQYELAHRNNQANIDANDDALARKVLAAYDTIDRANQSSAGTMSSTLTAAATAATGAVAAGAGVGASTPTTPVSGSGASQMTPPVDPAVTAANNLIHGDQNNSGSLSAFEKRVFDRVDRNHDGTISRGEAQYELAHRNNQANIDANDDALARKVLAAYDTIDRANQSSAGTMSSTLTAAAATAATGAVAAGAGVGASTPTTDPIDSNPNNGAGKGADNSNTTTVGAAVLPTPTPTPTNQPQTSTAGVMSTQSVNSNSAQQTVAPNLRMDMNNDGQVSETERNNYNAVDTNRDGTISTEEAYQHLHNQAAGYQVTRNAQTVAIANRYLAGGASGGSIVPPADPAMGSMAVPPRPNGS